MLDVKKLPPVSWCVYCCVFVILFNFTILGIGANRAANYATNLKVENLSWCEVSIKGFKIGSFKTVCEEIIEDIKTGIQPAFDKLATFGFWLAVACGSLLVLLGLLAYCQRKSSETYQ